MMRIRDRLVLAARGLRFALTQWIERTHLGTDPLCEHYKPAAPGTRWNRRGRGINCAPCRTKRESAAPAPRPATGMSNPVHAILALDGLPIGAQIVACDIDEAGEARGTLFEHISRPGGRTWRNVTFGNDYRSAGDIVSSYTDMVITSMGLETSEAR